MSNSMLEVSVRILSPRPNRTSGTGGSGIGNVNVVRMLERQQRDRFQDEYDDLTPVPPVNRIGGRLRVAVASLPEYSLIERSRQEERARGGPSAPRNSLEISVITLDDTTDINETDADEINDETMADEYRQGHDTEPDPDDDVFSGGVPPVLQVQRTEPAIGGQVDEIDDVNVNITIDLTDSPPRHSQVPNNSPPRQAQVTSPSAAALKCPVCLETFLAIRRRGSRLVSTVCGHVFCGRCLPACVRTSGHCPTCRKIIGYEDFHPLYLY